MDCDVISSKFSHFYASDEDEKIEDSRKAGFEFVFKSGFFRNNRDKTEVSFLFFFDQKPGCPVYITH